jgi:hypothetical protein
MLLAAAAAAACLLASALRPSHPANCGVTAPPPAIGVQPILPSPPPIPPPPIPPCTSAGDICEAKKCVSVMLQYVRLLVYELVYALFRY